MANLLPNVFDSVTVGSLDSAKILFAPRSLFWVGGTGNWSDATNHWATSSGGLPNAANLPTANDNVTFDTLSNATAYTVTVDATSNCNNFTLGAPLSGKVTWAGGSALNIQGNMNLSGGTAGITRTYTGTITFTSGAAGQTITCNGVALSGGVTFNGFGGGWQFQDAFNIGVTASLTLTNGFLDTNGQTVTCGAFLASNNNVKTLAIGASTINCSSWSMSSTGFTFSQSGSTIAISQGGSGSVFAGTGLTYNIVTITNTNNGTISITGANTFATLTITGPASAKQSINFQNSNTITGVLTINGNSTTNRVLAAGPVAAPITLTVGSVVLSNVDFMDITAAGNSGSAWTGTSIGNCLGNTNITFTVNAGTTVGGGVFRYWVGNGGNWSDTAHWATSSGGSTGASVPLPQDTVIIDANSITSGSQTITGDIPRLGFSVDFSNVANTPIFSYSGGTGNQVNGSGPTVCGPLTFVSGMSLATNANSNLIFGGRANCNFTTGGLTIDQPVYQQMPGATLTLVGNLILNSARALSQGNGGLDAATNNVNVTAGSFKSNITFSTRSISMGNGTWEMQGTGTIWDTNTSAFTVTANGSTIKITDSTNTATTFTGSNFTYNNIWYARGGSTASNTLSGNNTFADFKDTGTAAHSILFTAGSTTTVSTFTVVGNGAGNEISINSAAASTSTHTLTKVGASSVQSDYLNIQHSVAQGAGLWFAGSHSINNQAVATAGSGWIFDVGWGSGVDNITVSESVTIKIVDNINVSQTVTITEAVTMQVVDFINVSDSITVSESVTVKIVDFASVSDSITVSEAVQIVIVLKPNVSDSITVTDVPTVTIPLLGAINVSDSISVSEFAQFQIVSFVNVNDSVSVSEAIQMQIVSFISVSDSISVAEAVTITEVDIINVSDSVSVSEAVTILILDTGLSVNVSDSVTVSENIQMQVVLLINVSDSVTVTEAVTIAEAQYVPTVGDDITVSEFVQMQIVSFINVSDSISVSEATQFLIVYQSSVFDSVTVSEAVQMQVVSFINVADNVSVNEAVALVIVSGSSVFDTVTVSEFVQMRVVSFVNVVDSVTVAEATQMQIVDYIVVSDSISVSEAVTIQIVSQPSGLFDTVTVSESIKMMLISFINVFDLVHVTDTIQTQTTLFINVSDSITVSEHIQIGIFIPIVKFVGTVKLGWKFSGYTVAGEREESYVVSEALNKTVDLRL